MFEMGFTTLPPTPWPNMFAGHNSGMRLRGPRRLRHRHLFGPRMDAGGYATMTGSHLDLISPRSVRREPDATADGPWELRKLARKQLRLGVDFIKTCASGGGGTDAEDPEIRNMTQEELDAVVDEAHCQNKHCSCHCFTPHTQLMAMKAGVDTIEHCVSPTTRPSTNWSRPARDHPDVAPPHRWAIEIRRGMGTSGSP
jgi:imidazolonepropionase-like amidohydrolase